MRPSKSSDVVPLNDLGSTIPANLNEKHELAFIFNDYSRIINVFMQLYRTMLLHASADEQYTSISFIILDFTI